MGASMSNATTMKWPPPVSARSIFVMQLCWAPPTICNCSSTRCATLPSAMARVRRSCLSHSTVIMVQACTATSLYGKTASRFSPATVTPDCQRWRSSTSAGCSNTPLPSSPLPLLPLTVTSASCPVLKPRLISPTRRAIDQRQYVSPCSRAVPSLPGSLDEALLALEADNEFLLKGDVFTSGLIDRWIAYKREKEIQPLRMRPHPLEFSMYFD